MLGAKLLRVKEDNVTESTDPPRNNRDEPRTPADTALLLGSALEKAGTRFFMPALTFAALAGRRRVSDRYFRLVQEEALELGIVVAQLSDGVTVVLERKLRRWRRLGTTALGRLPELAPAGIKSLRDEVRKFARPQEGKEEDRRVNEPTRGRQRPQR
jgi:hypothetical protein